MNKQNIPKLCSLILIVCLLIPSAFAAQGGDDAELPMYTGLSSFSASLSISSGGSASCYSGAAASNSTYSVVLTMRLQQSTDRLNWITMKTWTSSGAIMPSLSKSYQVVSGYYYRLYCTAKVYNSSGTLLGTNTKYSSVESY